MLNEEVSNISEELTLLNLQESNKILREGLKTLQKQANEASLQRHTVEWNISRSDFVAFYQQQKIDNQMALMNRLRTMVKAAEDKRLNTQAEKEECMKLQTTLIAQIKQARQSVECLEKVDSRNKETVAELQREITILKNRNAAIRVKLGKQQQDFEEQINKYSAMLSCEASKKRKANSSIMGPNKR